MLSLYRNIFGAVGAIFFFLLLFLLDEEIFPFFFLLLPDTFHYENEMVQLFYGHAKSFWFSFLCFLNEQDTIPKLIIVVQ